MEGSTSARGRYFSRGQPRLSTFRGVNGELENDSAEEAARAAAVRAAMVFSGLARTITVRRAVPLRSALFA